MKTEYCTVETRTAKGIKKAEQMKSQGWEIVSARLFSILFRRDVQTKKKYAFDPEILKGLRKMAK